LVFITLQPPNRKANKILYCSRIAISQIIKLAPQGMSLRHIILGLPSKYHAFTRCYQLHKIKRHGVVVTQNKNIHTKFSEN